MFCLSYFHSLSVCLSVLPFSIRKLVCQWVLCLYDSVCPCLSYFHSLSASLSICLSEYLYVCPSYPYEEGSLSVSLCLHVSSFFFAVLISLPFCLPDYLSICLSVRLSYLLASESQSVSDFVSVRFCLSLSILTPLPHTLSVCLCFPVNLMLTPSLPLHLFVWLSLSILCTRRQSLEPGE